jgi:general nucleoside transport system ATP-binding protein
MSLNSESGPPLLEMRGITVIYSHNLLKANDGVDLTVRDGEIHALVGENGAGKTTLMKVLYGLLTPQEGEILLEGKSHHFHHPHEAAEAGIGMVPQHFEVIPEFTVTQNIVLGREPRRGILYSPRRAEAAVTKLIRDHGFNLDPRTPASDLSVSQLQQVEILKVLYRKARILILDEPTAVLTEQEIHALFDTLRHLQALGKTIILITHKLAEVMEISRRVSVMRKGRLEAVLNTEETSKAELSRLMVGREVLFDVVKTPRDTGDPVYAIRRGCVHRRGQVKPLLEDIDLTVHRGEILGITAVAGNGLSELEDAVAGMEPFSTGEVRLRGQDVAHWDSRKLRRAGFAYVPSNRLYRGASLGSSVGENLVVADHHGFLTSWGGFHREKTQRFLTDRLNAYGVSAPSSVPMGTLSGGNIQRCILARELSHLREFVLFAEPTWGLDIASAEYVYRRLLELRAQGTGILMLSSNLDEIVGLSDTILVLYHGRVVGALDNRIKVDKELVGEYMLGVRDDFAGECHERA